MTSLLCNGVYNNIEYIWQSHDGLTHERDFRIKRHT